jgi:hypothetical protein
VGSFWPMTAYSGLRLMASASGLLSRPMPRADSRNAAGVFSASKVSDSGPRRKPSPEARQAGWVRNADRKPLPSRPLRNSLCDELR